MSDAKMLIDGQYVDARAGESFEVHNPATGAVVTTYPLAQAEDIDLAARAAERGFQLWRRTPTAERAAVLHKAASIVRDRAQRITEAITLEMGKPIAEARSETLGVADLFDYFAEEGIRVMGEVPQMDLPNELPMIVKQPIGVVGAITPFNYPIALLTWKLGPALITGCSIVAKPDEHSPTSVMLVAQCLLDGGLPPSVLNVVTGGAEAGKALVSHPAIRKIAFTGSVEVGQAIASAAGSLGKQVTLELGGQCPAIVSDDVDLDAVIPDFVKHAFNNAGQYCYRINRAYVQNGIYERFLDRLTEQVSKIKVGPGNDPSVTMGPLGSEDVYQSTLRHITDAVAKGARVRYGGQRLTGSGFDSGYYFLPTVIQDTNHSMLVMQEETFGPVLGVEKVASVREAIDLSNDSRYGLAAYVFTKDAGLGLQIARQVEAGSVWVNRVQKAYYLLPFGGMKQSGQGREKSKYGLDEYLELKTIYLGLPQLD